MKKQIIFLILILLPIVVKAYDAYINGIYYNLSENKATVTYNKTSYNSYSGDIVIPTSVTYNGITYIVTSIGDEAFYNCRGLTSVTIPDYVTSIGVSAFESCIDLNYVSMSEKLTSIGGFAFAGCIALTKIPLPNSVNKIDFAAFEGCSSLTSFVIPEGVTDIKANTFWGCSSLSSITIPNSVAYIDHSAFFKCTSLNSITIPKSVTKIHEQAIRACSSLSSIVVEDGNTKYDSRNNCNAIIETKTNKLIVGCNNTIIPETVTAIGDYGFQGSGIASITIPKSVTNIGEYTFQACNNLTSVITTSISRLPISEGTFSNSSNATLYVPFGSKNDYAEADYWKEFKKIIEHPNPDVNQDGDVNVLDVVDMARFVIGLPAQTFVEIIADINGDGVVNLGDAVELINDIAGDQIFVRVFVTPHHSGYGMLTLREKDGCFSLCLNNERRYTAFQFDLYVPENTDVPKILLNSERKMGHQLLYNKIGESRYRVAALSTSNNEFYGYEGELLNIAIKGFSGEEIGIRNIHFFDVKGNDYPFEDIERSTITSFENIEHSTLNIEHSIYNVAGQHLNKMQKGINIVDGKKLIVK